MNAFSSSKELLNEERKGGVINRDIPRLITPPCPGCPRTSRGECSAHALALTRALATARSGGGQRSARSVFAPGWGEDRIYPRALHVSSPGRGEYIEVRPPRRQKQHVQTLSGFFETTERLEPDSCEATRRSELHPPYGRGLGKPCPVLGEDTQPLRAFGFL